MAVISKVENTYVTSYQNEQKAVGLKTGKEARMITTDKYQNRSSYNRT